MIAAKLREAGGVASWLRGAVSVAGTIGLLSRIAASDGFEYDGQHYRSLTVIAEKITRAHWSEPRFFGLTRRAGDRLLP